MGGSAASRMDRYGQLIPAVRPFTEHANFLNIRGAFDAPWYGLRCSRVVIPASHGWPSRPEKDHIVGHQLEYTRKVARGRRFHPFRDQGTNGLFISIHCSIFQIRTSLQPDPGDSASVFLTSRTTSARS